MKYNLSHFDINALITQIAGELKPNIEKKGLVLTLRLVKEPTVVNGDVGKLKQVISNIIDNAVKYTPAGSITVTTALNAAAKKVLVSVSDTGLGISEKTLPNLFQKFSRAEDASKANIMGTGLGLYVAKELVKAHNGKIWAESPGEGKGSTFNVELDVVNDLHPANISSLMGGGINKVQA
jgi:signal transduction histidine kinase